MVRQSKEENHDHSADQDQSYNQELGLQDQEEGESGLSENLDYRPVEGTLDQDMSELQKKKTPREH